MRPMLEGKAQSFFAVGRGDHIVTGFAQRPLVGQTQEAAVVDDKDLHLTRFFKANIGRRRYELERVRV